MKKGGVGGGKTVTGLRFEERVNLLSKIAEVPGYEVRGNAIYYKSKLLAESYPKQKLYNIFLKERGVNYLDYVSKRYEPDEALYVPEQNTMYIIEMKFQGGSGSVDEKIQTPDFKKRIYTKLFSPLKLNVEFIYVLSSFFNHPRLDDTFAYIKEVGCSYYFEELPLTALNFPTPTVTASTPLDTEDVIAKPEEVVSN